MELPREYYEADLQVLKLHLETLIKNNELCQADVADNDNEIAFSEAEIDACGLDPYHQPFVDSVRKNIRLRQRSNVLINNNIVLHKLMIENDQAKIALLEKVLNG